ncbi:hypothetical protein D9M72_513680 [compost metagenome]
MLGTELLNGVFRVAQFFAQNSGPLAQPCGSFLGALVAGRNAVLHIDLGKGIGQTGRFFWIMRGYRQFDDIRQSDARNF